MACHLVSLHVKIPCVFKNMGLGFYVLYIPIDLFINCTIQEISLIEFLSLLNALVTREVC